MIQLQQKEIEKLAAITETTPMQIQKMLTLELLNPQRCLDALIVYDWRRLKQRGKYKVSQIIEALMERYKVNKWRVDKAIYYKRKKKKYCSECQKEISGHEYSRGKGKCDSCVAKEIEF